MVTSTLIMIIHMNKYPLVSKAIAMCAACLFLLNSLAYGLELDDPTTTATLAPTSKFNPIVSIKWDPINEKYVITENKKEVAKLVETASFKDDVAFLYINLLIGQFLRNIETLRKDGFSDRGLDRHLEKFKENVIEYFPDAVRMFGRFRFNDIYWEGAVLCLPYVRKDTGERQVLKYKSSNDADAKSSGGAAIPVGMGDEKVILEESADSRLPSPGEVKNTVTLKTLNNETEQIVRWVVSQYDLGEIVSIESLNPRYVFFNRLLVKVTLSSGRKVVIKELVRQPSQLKYLFWVENFLAKRGYITPLVFESKKGELFVQRGEYAYTAMEYVDGVQGMFRQPIFQRIQSARLLVEFHSLLRFAEPPGQQCIGGQFDEAGYYDEFEMNEKRMNQLIASISSRGPPSNEIERFILDNREVIRYHFKEAARRFPREQYEKIPKSIINGDFSPSNQIISGNDPKQGDVISVIDYLPSQDLRSRDFMSGFEAPSPGETTKTTLAHFTAFYQFEAIRKGFPLSEDEISVIPEVYRLSRLHNLTWIAGKDRVQKLLGDVNSGITTEYEFYQRKLRQLVEDFGTADAPISWGDFPELVRKCMEEHRQDPMLKPVPRRRADAGSPALTYDISGLASAMISAPEGILLPYAPAVEVSALNEFLLLIKPDHQYTAESLENIFGRLSRFGYEIAAVRILNDEDFKREDLVRKNYPTIYNASTSDVLFSHERDRLREVYDKPEFIHKFGTPCSDLPVIPASWLVEKHGLSPDEVIELWYGWKKDDPEWKKVLTGDPCSVNLIGEHKAVYPVSHPKVNAGKPFFIMSGHFLDIKYRIFEKEGARTIAVVVRAISARSASCKVMREEFLGGNAIKARFGTVRRDIMEGNIAGVKGMTDATRNGIHMSDGPVAACREIAAFLRLQPHETTFGALLTKIGYTSSEIIGFTEDPRLYSFKRQTSLFDLTRNMDCSGAIKLMRDVSPPFYDPAASPPTVSLDQYHNLRAMYRAGRLSGNKNRETLKAGDISPPGQIEEFASVDSELYKKLRVSGNSLVRNGRVAQLIMSGGTSGRMLGYEKPEAERIRGFVEAVDINGRGYDFFALKLLQLQRLGRESGSVIPVYFQLSQKNEANVIEGLRQRDYYGYDAGAVDFFTTGLIPRMHLNRDDRRGVTLPSDASSADLDEWAGEEFRFSDLRTDKRGIGHLDVITSLWLTKTLLRMAERGIEYIDVVDPGDIGAILDPALVAHFADSKAGILVVVAEKDPADPSAGAPYLLGGRPVILEGFQLPVGMQSSSPYQATVHYLFKVSSLMNLFKVRSTEEYRGLSREDLYRKIEEATSSIPFAVDIKMVNDNGTMVPAANLIRSIADFTRLIPADIVKVDRAGEKTYIGFLPHKSGSDILRQAAVSEKFVRSRILAEDSSDAHQKRPCSAAELQSTLTRLLKESLYEVPYNSCTTAMDAVGDTTPIKFGGNCLHQSRILRDKIKKTLPGVKISYLIDEGYHHALLVGDADTGLFYLDPYLMQLEAVSVPSSPATLEVGAYPVFFGNPGKLVVERKDGDKLIVTKYIHNKYASESMIQTHRFEFDLNTDRRDQHLDTRDKKLAIRPDATTLSIKALLRSGEMVCYVYSIPKNTVYMIDPYGEKVFSQEEDFEKWFGVLLGSIGVNRDEFLTYLQHGLAAYKYLAAGMTIDFQYPNAINAVDVEPTKASRQKTMPPRWLYYIKEGSEEEKTLGESLSYLKMGYFDDVQKHARRLVQKIKLNLGDTLDQEVGGWAVCNIGGTGIPNDAHLIAREVAKQLGMPHIMIETRKRGNLAAVLGYTKMGSSDERRRAVEGALGVRDTDIPAIKGKKIILIDDALTAGVLLKEAEKVLLDIGTGTITPYVIAVFDGLGNHAFENKMNHKALIQDPIGVLSKILNDERSAYTTALVKFSFELSPSDFASLLDKLTISAKLNLYLYSVEYFSNLSPQATDILVKQIEKVTGVRFFSSSFLRSIQAKKFFSGIADMLRNRNYRAKVEDAAKIQKEMELLFDSTELAEEKNIAIDFRDSIVEQARSAKESGRKIIVALGTNWIPGYGKNYKSTQYRELNELIVSIRKFCEERDIPFIDKNDEALIAEINTQKTRKGYGNAKVVVLASADTLEKELSTLQEAENTFILGVDRTNLTDDSYIRVMEMLKVTINYAINPDIPPQSHNISIERRGRFWIFVPKAEPLKMETLRAIYEIQKFA